MQPYFKNLSAWKLVFDMFHQFGFFLPSDLLKSPYQPLTIQHHVEEKEQKSIKRKKKSS